jgi:hypothetical protein
MFPASDFDVTLGFWMVENWELAPELSEFVHVYIDLIASMW